jgi:small subunit ribosomal protein S14
MAKKCKMVTINDEPKFEVRRLNRCQRCGRSKGVYRKFGICRICFRELAHRGMIPGVTKASW